VDGSLSTQARDDVRHQQHRHPIQVINEKTTESGIDSKIVILPYNSMAAATRVNTYKYKEIITPTWRKIEDEVEGGGGKGKGEEKEKEKSPEKQEPPPPVKEEEEYVGEDITDDTFEVGNEYIESIHEHKQ
jgi:hypothetical protein